ncbi:hypothetical protein [Pseudorhodoplanes sp.]|uniref:hypothetical protein n=1 Tax=Pseudorhodoplanes sp. TaxID=1934341 RepID=UPI002C130BFC|nr:hypothetical protein [Pseudorhodoplanes sp.]HWV44069.1 hypothetical protein [Pseudorhodoplanes sp.]
MTARAHCTQAEIQRRIRAAKAEGLRVRGIAPDGTILVDGAGLELEVGATLPPEASKWMEVKA